MLLAAMGQMGTFAQEISIDMKKDYPEMPAIDIHMYKHIPTGAGLGGGSADAAFMIKLLNEKFKLNLSIEKMEEYAAILGADCAFFIENEPAYASGIGDELEPFDVDLKGRCLVVYKPEVHVSTAEAYKGIEPKKAQENVRDILRRPIEEWKHKLVNDFEESVFKNHPEIKAVKDMMYERGAIYASMSGSGSAVYGIFDEEVTIEGGITLKL